MTRRTPLPTRRVAVWLAKVLTAAIFTALVVT